MSRYYIESHSNLIKIYKDSVDNNLVFNNILFSSYSEAKFYLLHFKDTIFEKLGYTNCYDEDLKEYTSLKNKINDLEQKIITIDTIIKKHENTREEKEIDRIKHVDTVNAQTGPIFLAYKKNDDLKK